MRLMFPHSPVIMKLISEALVGSKEEPCSEADLCSANGELHHLPQLVIKLMTRLCFKSTLGHFSAHRRRRSAQSAKSLSWVWTGPERAACCKVWLLGSRRRRGAAADPPAASTSWASTPPPSSSTSWRVRLLLLLTANAADPVPFLFLSSAPPLHADVSLNLHGNKQLHAGKHIPFQDETQTEVRMWAESLRRWKHPRNELFHESTSELCLFECGADAKQHNNHSEPHDKHYVTEMSLIVPNSLRLFTERNLETVH